MLITQPYRTSGYYYHQILIAMKRMNVLSLLLWFTLSLCAQQKAFVFLNYEENTLNDGQPLPAYQDIAIVGGVAEAVNMVELQILPYDKPNATPLYRTRWKNPPDTKPELFTIALGYQLRPNKLYDFKFQYFSILNEQERADLIRLILNKLGEVIYDATEAQRLGVGQPSDALIKRLNQTVLNELKIYRPQTELPWEGFSDLVVQKIADLETLRSLDSLQNAKKETLEKRRKELVASLEDVVQREAVQYVDQPMALLIDARYVEDVKIKQSPATFGLSAGYVWVYVDGAVDNKDFVLDAAPYIGLSVSLSNPDVSNALRRGSLHAGFFLTNLKRHPTKLYSGPVFDKPIYIGLDYKLYKWVRLSLGGVLIQEKSGKEHKPVLMKPFAGLGVRLRIGATLDE